MYIEELKEQESDNEKGKSAVVIWNARRILVGAGARALFYPTLLYNVVRNKIQSEFRWWDRVDEFVLLGAVPFPTDVPQLQAIGVGGVVTLNEPFETLVPTSLYQDHNIRHLVVPTRDYLFAPSYGVISQAVEFIHGNALCNKITNVHCKAGRGRSTTVVLCYLVKYKNMTPEEAYISVKSIRPRVLLASSQRKAVQDYHHTLKKPRKDICMNNSPSRTLGIAGKVSPVAFEDNSLVVITESDLDGYEENDGSNFEHKKILLDLKLACKVQFAAQAAIAQLSCLWLRWHTSQKPSRKSSASSLGKSQLGATDIDVSVC